MRLQSIKLDRAFPETGTKKLEALLSDGCTIYEKESGERYTIYIMRSWNVEQDNLTEANPKHAELMAEFERDIKNIFKNYWYHAGRWHEAECASIMFDWGVCNCKTGKNNEAINEALATQARDAIKELLASSRKV